MSLRGILGLFGLAGIVSGQEPLGPANNLIDDASNDLVDDAGNKLVWV